MNADLEELRRSPALLLLSDDEALSDLVFGIVEPPWKLVRQSADGYLSHKRFAQPNVQLVILDDQAVKEDDRNWLLAQIREDFNGSSLLYVAGSQSDDNEKRARANGAHYYIPKPLPHQRFAHVLRSFLRLTSQKINL